MGGKKECGVGEKEEGKQRKVRGRGRTKRGGRGSAYSEGTG